MKKNNEILGGFAAMFDTLSSNEPIKIKGVEIAGDEPGADDDTKAFDLDDEDEDEEDEFPLETSKLDIDEPALDKANPTTDEEAIVDIDEAETQQVGAFFDALAESVGWSDIDETERPTTVEGLVDYMKAVVEASSAPEYANEDIANLDAYVKNGGSIKDYLEATETGVDYDNLDMEDTGTQKAVIKEFLSSQGYSDIQIKRKLEKYEDADLLADEADDAYGFLKESKIAATKALLEEQKIANATAIEAQQTFYNSVVQEIESLNEVRGIKIPKDDKKALMGYIFDVEADGRTKYQKDYSKSNKNLIESAYFTMKGDKLINQARIAGETSAVARLKNSLTTNMVRGSKQTINNGSATPLWSMASQQLLRKP